MKIFKSISIIIIYGSVCFGVQKIESDTLNKPYFQLQSIHLDVTSAIFINDFSISSDLEIYKTHLQSFGIQPGYGYLLAGDAAETEYGSPFHDINLLAYTSIGMINLLLLNY